MKAKNTCQTCDSTKELVKVDSKEWHKQSSTLQELLGLNYRPQPAVPLHLCYDCHSFIRIFVIYYENFSLYALLLKSTAYQNRVPKAPSQIFIPFHLGIKYSKPAGMRNGEIILHCDAVETDVQSLDHQSINLSENTDGHCAQEVNPKITTIQEKRNLDGAISHDREPSHDSHILNLNSPINDESDEVTSSEEFLLLLSDVDDDETTDRPEFEYLDSSAMLGASNFNTISNSYGERQISLTNRNQITSGEVVFEDRICEMLQELEENSMAPNEMPVQNDAEVTDVKSDDCAASNGAESISSGTVDSGIVANDISPPSSDESLTYVSKTVFLCNLCDKTFLKQSYLRRHQQRHEQPLDSVQEKRATKENRRRRRLLSKMRRKYLEIPVQQRFNATAIPIAHQPRTQLPPLRQQQKQTQINATLELCDTCGEIVDSKVMEKHQVVHLKPFVLLQSSTEVAEAVRRYIDNAYKCAQCKCMFTSESVLVLHQRVFNHFEKASQQPDADESINNVRTLRQSVKSLTAANIVGEEDSRQPDADESTNNVRALRQSVKPSTAANIVGEEDSQRQPDADEPTNIRVLRRTVKPITAVNIVEKEDQLMAIDPKSVQDRPDPLDVSEQNSLRLTITVPKNDGKLIECKVCKRSFTRVCDYTRHKNSLHNPTGIQFQKNVAKRRHNTTIGANVKCDTPSRVSKQTKFQACSMCGQRFTHLEDLVNHQNDHLRQFASTKLSAVVSSEKLIDPDNDGIYTCHECNCTFAKKAYYLGHRQRHSSGVKRSPGGDHQMQPRVYLVCLNQQPSVCINHPTPTTAKQTTVSCTICKFEMANNVNSIERHRKSHMLVKSYKCNLCPSTYVKKYSVKLHQSSHYNYHAKYKCTFCPSTFGKSSYLEVHLRWHKYGSNSGTGTAVGAYLRCSMCQGIFTHRSNLVQHLTTHKNSTPYTCAVCNNTFKTKGNLIRHQKAYAIPPKCDSSILKEYLAKYKQNVSNKSTSN